ncbi:MAG TPA: thioesterase domain-containing protein [Polyangiales bacterium]|nr:thioesterase domain-containing protein [Polyangiales bacterium]
MTQPQSAPHTQRRVLLQAAGVAHAQPLFIFPGVNGEPSSFTDLASRLGHERAIYGFHLVGSLRECEPVRQMGRLAQLYAAEIRGTQPRGPYFLFGYSFGGALAFEVARELMSHGERIGLVAMADCPAPGYPKAPPVFVRARVHAQNLLQLTAAERGRYMRDRLENGVTRLGRMIGAHPVDEEGIPPHVERVNAALREAFENYEPAPLSVDTLFLTADTPPDWPAIVFDDPLMGWGPMLRGRISQCGVPGTHLSIFAPDHVPFLAERLRSALRRVEQAQVARAAASIKVS